MDKTALVSVDLEKGGEILRILDDAGLNVKVALWAYLPEYEDWRFIVASRKLDEVGEFRAYGLIRKALDKDGITVEETPLIMIMNMSERFIKSLRGIYGKTKNVLGKRIGWQTIGDRFVEDAYIYRVS